METKICPNCGTENPVQANFCRGCRYAFNNPNKEVDQTTHAGDLPVREGKLPKTIVVALLVSIVIAVSAIVFIVIKPFAGEKSEVKIESVQGYIPETFAGDYAMKLASGDIVSRYTAVVKEFASNKYRVEVITEYGKSMYTFTAEPDGTVDSPELGKGKVSYKANINKLTIEFSGRDSRCELSRIQ